MMPWRTWMAHEPAQRLVGACTALARFALAHEVDMSRYARLLLQRWIDGERIGLPPPVGSRWDPLHAGDGGIEELCCAIAFAQARNIHLVTYGWELVTVAAAKMGVALDEALSSCVQEEMQRIHDVDQAMGSASGIAHPVSRAALHVLRLRSAAQPRSHRGHRQSGSQCCR